MLTLSSTRLPLVLAGCLLIGGAIGCRHASTPVGRPVVPARSVTDATVAQRVQLYPLFVQACAACSQKQYGKAADLLAQLAGTPGLAPDETRYCRTQRDICLRDSGALPALSSAAPSPGAPAQAGGPADCGPRALAIVCNRLGVEASVSRLAHAAGTGKHGTSMAGLQRAAESVGLKATGVQLSRDALRDLSTPAVAWTGNHFIAVLSISGAGDDATATVRDPNERVDTRMGCEHLNQLCRGYMLLVER